MKRVVVTGMGVVSAVGLTPEIFWQRLLTSNSGVRTISSFDVSNYTTKFGACVETSQLDEGSEGKAWQNLSRTCKMAILAARQAVRSAGLDDSERPGTGSLVACSQAGYVESEPFFKSFFEKGRASPLVFMRSMNSLPATQVSIDLKLTGPVMAIDTACSSANHAIGLAALLIRTGAIQRALAGGVDTPFSPGVFASWCALRALSRENASPQKACKPFSANRDGTVLGEGSGIVVLESEETAIRRGAPILAEVIGYGFSGDAHDAFQPSTEGLSAAILGALKDACLVSPSIDYVNAHATGTTLNDASETEAIKRVFGRHAYTTPISGIKPIVGHTLAASAALEFIACVMAINEGRIPPTANYEDPDPKCDLDYVTEGARHLDVRRCMSISAGFGGSNAVLMLQRYERS